MRFNGVNLSYEQGVCLFNSGYKGRCGQFANQIFFAPAGTGQFMCRLRAAKAIQNSQIDYKKGTFLIADGGLMIWD